MSDRPHFLMHYNEVFQKDGVRVLRWCVYEQDANDPRLFHLSGRYKHTAQYRTKKWPWSREKWNPLPFALVDGQWDTPALRTGMMLAGATQSTPAPVGVQVAEVE